MRKDYTWRVLEGLTDRSGKRLWPAAFYKNSVPAAKIMCIDEYNGMYQGHAPLMLFVADHSKIPWIWRKAKIGYATLEEVKEAFDSLLIAHPYYKPNTEKSEVDG